VLGEGAPRWQRLEAVAQEYLGAHGGDEADDQVVAGALAARRGESLEDRPGAGSGGGEGEADGEAGEAAGEVAAGEVAAGEVAAGEAAAGEAAAGGEADGEAADGSALAAPGWRAELEAYLEEETGRWAFLESVAPVAAPPVDEEAHPAELDAALRELAALRERWESLLGHLALLVRMLGLWRDMQFVSFAHFCRERLGLGIRQVEQRIALERRLHALPSLRAALAVGRLDAERARLVARVAEEPSAGEWIDRAERTPTVALRRKVEALEAMPHASWMVAAQRCAPEEPVVELRMRVPVRVAALLAAAFRAAQRAPGPDGRVGWRSESECLLRVATHFIEAWRDLPQPRSTPQRRALHRDGHRCQVPGCSRAAVHAHHVRYRSRGGGDDVGNLVSLCAPPPPGRPPGLRAGLRGGAGRPQVGDGRAGVAPAGGHGGRLTGAVRRSRRRRRPPRASGRRCVRSGREASAAQCWQPQPPWPSGPCSCGGGAVMGASWPAAKASASAAAVAPAGEACQARSPAV
jgi:hypothetical protein